MRGETNRVRNNYLNLEARKNVKIIKSHVIEYRHKKQSSGGVI